MVLAMRVELIQLAPAGFESAVSTIPPRQHIILQVNQPSLIAKQVRPLIHARYIFHLALHYTYGLWTTG